MLATASWFLVERPVQRWRPSGWPRMALAPVAAGVTALVMVVATVPAVAAPAPSAEAAAAQAAAAVGSGQGLGDPTGVGAPAAPLDLPAFGPTDPLRVTVLGDSVAAAAEPALRSGAGRHRRGAGVQRHHRRLRADH